MRDRASFLHHFILWNGILSVFVSQIVQGLRCIKSWMIKCYNFGRLSLESGNPTKSVQINIYHSIGKLDKPRQGTIFYQTQPIIILARKLLGYYEPWYYFAWLNEVYKESMRLLRGMDEKAKVAVWPSLNIPWKPWVQGQRRRKQKRPIPIPQRKERERNAKV